MNMLLPAFAFSQFLEIGLPTTFALASITLVGYLFGNRKRTFTKVLDDRRQQELHRATRIVGKLDSIANRVREDLNTHHSQLTRFKRRLQQAQYGDHAKAWEHLCNEAEAILDPTLQLAQQLSLAYEEIRLQACALETFAPGRIDPITGVGNGRALEQQLRMLLHGVRRGGAIFSVALLGLGREGATASSSIADVLPRLPRLAGIIRACMRENDFVARYGDDEFVVVMPQTSLSGARVFAHRVQRRVVEELSATLNCGLAEMQEEDDSRALLGRADSALYSAKAAGVNRLFIHTGSLICEDTDTTHGSISEQTCADRPISVLGTPFVSMPTESAV